MSKYIANENRDLRPEASRLPSRHWLYVTPKPSCWLRRYTASDLHLSVDERTPLFERRLEATHPGSQDARKFCHGELLTDAASGAVKEG